MVNEAYVHNFEAVRELAELHNNKTWIPGQHKKILSEAREKLNAHFGFLRFEQEQVNVRYYVMQPAFDLGVLMSTIGGTLSLWGGVTVVVVVEFIQILCQLLASAKRSLRQRPGKKEIPLNSGENVQTKL